MDLEQILKECSANRARTTVLMQVKQLIETDDTAEVARMLSTGKWIAILATSTEPFSFVLGRVVD